jgi:hypothetical protein
MLGKGAGLRALLSFSSCEERSQGFADDGLFIGELAVFDLLSKKPLKILSESDVHNGKSCQPLEIRMALLS